MPGQACGYFLEKPFVAIGFQPQRRSYGTYASFKDPGDNAFFVKMVEYTAHVVERFTHFHTAILQIRERSLDVRDNEMNSVCRTGRGWRNSAAEDDRAKRTRRRE